jgi:hypothetical protein
MIGGKPEVNKGFRADGAPFTWPETTDMAQASRPPIGDR